MRNCVHSCVSRSVCTNYITMDTVKHLWWALNSAGFSVFELQLFQISTHMYFFIEWYIKFGRYRWHRLHSYALNYLSPTVMAQCKALVGKDTLIHTDSWQGHKSHVFFHSFTTLNKYAANDFWALGSTFKDPVWSTFWNSLCYKNYKYEFRLHFPCYVPIGSYISRCQAFWSSACANASALLNGEYPKEKRWLSISFWLGKSHKTA